MRKLASIEGIESRIHLIRGQKVMLDNDIADLYGVPTKRLNEAVKRNIARFPEEFMFQLTKEEAINSRSQIATLKRGKNIKYLPYAFTELGVAMLSSVLNSDHAVRINVLIIKAFVRLRQALAVNKELAQKFQELEGQIDRHDSEIQAIFEAIQKMLIIEAKPAKRIGFMVSD